uniref:Small ribosomal subunit protein mS29 n=1 Tax=Ditylenchus dipsaci TaxID=166011 RepID=A0A915CSQ1_9BILA
MAVLPKVHAVFRQLRCFSRTRRNFTDAMEAAPVASTEKLYAEPGKIYEVPMQTVEALNYKKLFPSIYTRQIDTLGCAWLCRESLVEAINCLQLVKPESPPLRLVLWGGFGTGKSITMYQLVHWAHSENFVLLTVKSGMTWNRDALDSEESTYKEGRINTPANALEALKTEKTYVWSRKETTAEGSSITSMIDVGLINPHCATDCVGALCRELRRYATMGTIKLFVAVDHANSFYGVTLVKKPDRTPAKAENVALIHYFKKFFRQDWLNGAVVMVADKAEFSLKKERRVIHRVTPLELLVKRQAFDSIDPFIPIETKPYTKAELDVMYDYYKDKQWLTSEKARTEEGRKQMMYLSDYNPYYFERICSFTEARKAQRLDKLVKKLATWRAINIHTNASRKESSGCYSPSCRMMPSIKTGKLVSVLKKK